MRIREIRKIITYSVGSPVVLDERQTFDALLGWAEAKLLCLSGASNDEITSAVYNLPIAKIQTGPSQWVYSAGMPVIAGKKYGGRRTFSKNTQLRRYIRMLPEKDIQTLIKGKCIQMQWGPAKSNKPSYEYFLCSTISYVCDVPVNRMEHFERLARSIGSIGKLRALGFGFVSGISIEDAPEGTVIKRPVPADSGIGTEVAGEISWMGRINPPYWEKGERVLCEIRSLT